MSEAPIVDLASDLERQRLTQEVVEKYERRIAKMREDFQTELANVVHSLQESYGTKPKRRALFSFGKKHDKVYIVFNHNSPVYCYLKDCPTRRPGFRHGIECVTFDIEVAQSRIDEYWQKNRKNKAAWIKLVEVDITDDIGIVEKEVKIEPGVWKENSKLTELLYDVPGTEDP